MAVGGAASARQGGTSFELKPVAGKPAVTLRGVVDFQWRHAKTVSSQPRGRRRSGTRASLAPTRRTSARETCVIG